MEAKYTQKEREYIVGASHEILNAFAILGPKTREFQTAVAVAHCAIDLQLIALTSMAPEIAAIAVVAKLSTLAGSISKINNQDKSEQKFRESLNKQLVALSKQIDEVHKSLSTQIHEKIANLDKNNEARARDIERKIDELKLVLDKFESSIRFQFAKIQATLQDNHQEFKADMQYLIQQGEYEGRIGASEHKTTQLFELQDKREAEIRAIQSLEIPLADRHYVLRNKQRQAIEEELSIEIYKKGMGEFEKNASLTSNGPIYKIIVDEYLALNPSDRELNLYLSKVFTPNTLYSKAVVEYDIDARYKLLNYFGNFQKLPMLIPSHINDLSHFQKGEVEYDKYKFQRDFFNGAGNLDVYFRSVDQYLRYAERHASKEFPNHGIFAERYYQYDPYLEKLGSLIRTGYIYRDQVESIFPIDLKGRPTLHRIRGPIANFSTALNRVVNLIPHLENPGLANYSFYSPSKEFSEMELPQRMKTLNWVNRHGITASQQFTLSDEQGVPMNLPALVLYNTEAVSEIIPYQYYLASELYEGRIVLEYNDISIIENQLEFTFEAKLEFENSSNSFRIFRKTIRDTDENYTRDKQFTDADYAERAIVRWNTSRDLMDQLASDTVPNQLSISELDSNLFLLEAAIRNKLDNNIISASNISQDQKNLFAEFQGARNLLTSYLSANFNQENILLADALLPDQSDLINDIHANEGEDLKIKYHNKVLEFIDFLSNRGFEEFNFSKDASAKHIVEIDSRLNKLEKLYAEKAELHNLAKNNGLVESQTKEVSLSTNGENKRISGILLEPVFKEQITFYEDTFIALSKKINTQYVNRIFDACIQETSRRIVEGDSKEIQKKKFNDTINELCTLVENYTSSQNALPVLTEEQIDRLLAQALTDFPNTAIQASWIDFKTKLMSPEIGMNESEAGRALLNLLTDPKLVSPEKRTENILNVVEKSKKEAQECRLLVNEIINFKSKTVSIVSSIGENIKIGDEYLVDSSAILVCSNWLNKEDKIKVRIETKEQATALSNKIKEIKNETEKIRLSVEKISSVGNKLELKEIIKNLCKDYEKLESLSSEAKLVCTEHAWGFRNTIGYKTGTTLPEVPIHRRSFDSSLIAWELPDEAFADGIAVIRWNDYVNARIIHRASIVFLGASPEQIQNSTKLLEIADEKFQLFLKIRQDQWDFNGWGSVTHNYEPKYNAFLPLPIVDDRPK